MKTVIQNARIIGPDNITDPKCLVIQEDRIAEIADTVPADADHVEDACGAYVSPGFIDMHVHGGGGHDFMDNTPEAVTGACRLHLSHGTTAIVPTTLTCPDEELFSFFEIYRQAKETMTDGPELLGIHLEGPWFSPAQAGAQDPAYLKIPDPAHVCRILDAGGKDVIRVSAAAELPGALELGDICAERGIMTAIGHSDATYEEVKASLQHGYSHVTHLYSGMSSLHRVGPYRVLGVVESAYLFDELTVEIIADGKHLPPELLKLILKCKPMDQICLITDAMRGAGLPEGEHVLLGSLTHGQDAVIKDGVAMLPDERAFAGSVCTTDRLVRTMVNMAGVPLTDAIRMMTLNPATMLGVSDRLGSIAPGKDADLCVFDDDIRIRQVWTKGKITFRGKED